MSIGRDWQILMNTSPVFRGYVDSSLKAKTASLNQKKISEAQTLENFRNLEEQIKENKILKNKFILFKEKIATDPQLRKQLGPKVVSAFEMLDLDDTEI